MGRVKLLGSICILTLICSPLLADVPQRTSYQGYLTDNEGNPLSGAFDITFRVYDDSAGGSPLYEETHVAVPVEEGLFSVLLGGKSFVGPFGDYLFDGPNRFLGTQVGADPELSPRIRLATVPYSFRTGTVDGATGGIIGGDVQVEGAVHSTSGGFQFPDNSVQATAASSAPTARTGWMSPYWINNSSIDLYTYISIYNVANVSNEVTLTFYDQTGAQVGQCLDTLGANAVWISGSSSAFTDPCVTGDGVGHFTITAVQPVAVWGAIYKFDLTAFLEMGTSLTFYAP